MKNVYIAVIIVLAILAIAIFVAYCKTKKSFAEFKASNVKVAYLSRPLRKDEIEVRKYRPMVNGKLIKGVAEVWCHTCPDCGQDIQIVGGAGNYCPACGRSNVFE